MNASEVALAVVVHLPLLITLSHHQVHLVQIDDIQRMNLDLCLLAKALPSTLDHYDRMKLPP